jgi:tartrate-resistant acid phosphatase type 5
LLKTVSMRIQSNRRDYALRFLLGAFLIASSLYLSAGIALAQPPALQPKLQLSEQLLDKIPAELREPARVYITLTEEEQRRWLGVSENLLRESVWLALASNPEAAAFVLKQLPREPSATARARVARNLPNFGHWRNNPGVKPMLQQLVAADADASVVKEALETLRVFEMRALREQLERRIEVEKRSGSGTLLTSLGQEQERWISLERGAMLPSFLRAAPPEFSLKRGRSRIRVLAFGDFGTGSDEQKRLAATMLRYHKQRRFDFGITLGDNFYPRGMNGLTDPRWQTQWESLYGLLKIEFYAVMGNHDWYGADSPAAEILYTAQSSSWRMPAPYYTFTAGDVQFFALDTNDVSESQLAWLDSALSKSRARWKVVYSHFPLYSATRGDNTELIAKLLPVMRGRVDVYIAGHDHNLQHLKAEGGINFFTSGGGGAGLYEVGATERALFKQQANGFAVIEADQTSIAVSFVGAGGQELYRYVIK